MYGNVFYLQEGIICPAQNALLLNNKTEQHLPEEVKSCFKGDSAGKGEKSFPLSEMVSLKKALFKEPFISFRIILKTGLLPATMPIQLVQIAEEQAPVKE